MTDDAEVPEMVPCLFVGGAADRLCRSVRLNAERVVLERPLYAKPLTHPGQTEPDVATEKTTYTIHPVYLMIDDTHAVATCLGIPEGGAAPREAWAALVEAYIQYQPNLEHTRTH